MEARVRRATARLAARQQLHDNVGVLLCGHHLLELHNVWVAELPQDLDLGLERLQILLVAERVVLHDLDRVFGSLRFMRGRLHHGEASSAQLIAKLVDRRDVLDPHVGQGSNPLFGVHLDLHAAH